MIFEKGYLYHVCNQGNNKQIIFFNRENYLFFLKKVNHYIKPYADILAWCLMPNHFHLMVLVNEIELPITHRVTSSHPVSNRSINSSIAILLRSYTRAINNQEKKSGALFRESTKAECINCFKGMKPSFIQSNMLINNLVNEKQYPQICFNYIHQNPVKANLVKNAEDWEFSSAMEYSGLRHGKLINKEAAKDYVDF
jgi:putative transposase